LKQRPRVLHVISILSVGGVEMWLVALLRHIRALAGDAGAETFDILMTGGQRSELDELAASLGANLHYIPFSRRNSRRFVRDFRKLLREREYTAIHDHQDYAAGWHFLAGAGILPPVRIVHVHSSVNRLHASTNTPARRVAFRISRKVLQQTSTIVLGTSGAALQEYGFTERIFPKQTIRTLHCGFDTAPFREPHVEANASVCTELGWPAGSPIVLFAGRLDGFDESTPGWNHKNPQFALDVARECCQRDSDVRFVFVGGGSSVQAELEAQVASWHLSDRIRFVGRRLDVARYMAASSCFIFPSREEGLGMVAVEAQAAGLRVLASDNVPRECVVIRELVSFRALSDGAAAWCEEILAMMELPRFDTNAANDAVRESSFSIGHSYAALHALYSGRSA
jgi:glycosyltransferase EpsF